tara:strand:+ start:698 stop:1273 length:576 start_codon:yes stop_codon:yes gene_type:complete
MLKNNLNWIEAPMPDSSPGTKLITYFVNENQSRSRLMLVEFPTGFTRDQEGHYPAYEELLILDGGLKISGHEFTKNDYVLFPPNFTRSDTSCPKGCIALVWWSTKPSWSRGRHENYDDEIIFKLDNDIEKSEHIDLNKNNGFHTVFINNQKNSKKYNKPFIGLDINSYEFVKGDSTDILSESKYFIKFTNF